MSASVITSSNLIMWTTFCPTRAIAQSNCCFTHAEKGILGKKKTSLKISSVASKDTNVYVAMLERSMRILHRQGRLFYILGK